MEFEHILQHCCRAKDVWKSRPSLASRTDEERRKTCAQARKLFVSALAEWVNMHDLHRPHAMGRPSKDQACAVVENEHSHKESVTVYCRGN